MEQFKNKTPEELKNQLEKAEISQREKFIGDDKREEALIMPLEELKQKYPERYQIYLKNLRIGSQKIEQTEDLKEEVYSAEEIKQIQETMGGKHSLDKNLIEKIKHDQNIAKNSIAIFFPVIGEKIKERRFNEVSPISTGARERALKVSFGSEAFVIKTLENDEESKIAQIASDLDVGPKQVESIKGFLTEEWVEGDLIKKIDPEKCTSEYMESLGKKVGINIKKLHEKNIVINDQLLRDDFGKCHTIMKDDGDIRFIDFGASVDLSNFPDLKDEEILCLMRSDPFASMSLHGISSDEQLAAAIKRYKDNLLSNFKNKEDLMKSRDYQLLNEGIGFLGHVLPNMDSFVKGIQETLLKEGK